MLVPVQPQPAVISACAKARVPVNGPVRPDKRIIANNPFLYRDPDAAIIMFLRNSSVVLNPPRLLRMREAPTTRVG